MSPDTLVALADPAPAQACSQIHRHRPWHPMIRPLQRVSSDIARPAGTRCSRSPISCRPPPTRQPRRRCALPPPDFPHFKHVCTPTVLASLAPAAPTASSAVLNYTLASSTACAASASPSLQACAHPVLPHLHFLKRVSTDPTFALRAPFAPAAFLPHLHLLKHVPNDTTLALMAPASACVTPKLRLLHFTLPVYVASRSFP